MTMLRSFGDGVSVVTLDAYTPEEYSSMLTVIETRLFRKLWPNYWTGDERGEFAAFIARHPAASLTGAVLKEIRRALEE